MIDTIYQASTLQLKGLANLSADELKDNNYNSS